MPRDPFADDPNDPASLFDDDDPMPPLTQEERIQIERDLILVRKFKAALQPRGINGIFFYCEDCDQQHFYDWDIMTANMRSTLAGELSPVHEPSANPNPDAYLPWDYCLGYLDGMNYRGWESTRNLYPFFIVEDEFWIVQPPQLLTPNLEIIAKPWTLGPL